MLFESINIMTQKAPLKIPLNQLYRLYVETKTSVELELRTFVENELKTLVVYYEEKEPARELV